MKRRVIFNFIIVIFLFILSYSRYGQSKTASTSTIANIESDEVLISSIPSHLKVYMKKIVNESHEEFFTKKNLKGITPIVMKLDSGNYIVGMTRVYEIGYQYKPFGNISPYRFHEDKNNLEYDNKIVDLPIVVRVIYSKGVPESIVVGRIFHIEKEELIPKKFKVLHYPNNSTIKTLDQLYPKGDNVTFNERALSDEFLKKGVSKDELHIILDLLNRGGKVAYKAKDETSITIEIIKDKWDVYGIKDGRIIQELATLAPKAEFSQNWLKYPPPATPFLWYSGTYKGQIPSIVFTIKNMKDWVTAYRIVCDSSLYKYTYTRIGHDYPVWGALIVNESRFEANDVPVFPIESKIKIADIKKRYGPPMVVGNFVHKGSDEGSTVFWYGPIMLMFRNDSQQCYAVGGWPSRLIETPRKTER